MNLGKDYLEVCKTVLYLTSDKKEQKHILVLRDED